MITEIRLNGMLGKKVGRKIWRLDVKNVHEACHAINVLTKGKFVQEIIDEEHTTQGYHIQVGKRTIGEDLFEFGFGGDVIRITPILQGADTKGIITIVAGAALIAVGIVATAYGVPLGPQIALLGFSIALGGVARLLISAPPQTLGTQDKTRASYIFSGIVNTVQQGECVPVAYGNPWVGSAVGSAGMESIDVNV